jgi:hypothetical protein
MIQADSVHSTPRTNASKIDPPDPTRRRLLTVAAGGAVAVVAGIPTSAAVDPAFALIAEKLAADVAHCEAIDAQGEFDGRRDHSSDAAIEAQDNSEDACHYANDVDWKLATTPPTTLAGVAAVLRFANEIEDAGGEWPHTDTIGPDGWHYQLRATMAAAVEGLIRKAVQL